MLQLPNQTAFYKGKVRDVYTIGDKHLAMVVSDRISAFDVVLPRPIPFKGQVLNQLAAYFLDATKDILPNWVLDGTSLPNATIGLKCETYPVEMVIRGNLTGHAWRTYKSGARMLCGVAMPEGMKENDYFPEPILTPTTKAHEGHLLGRGRGAMRHPGRRDISALRAQLSCSRPLGPCCRIRSVGYRRS